MIRIVVVDDHPALRAGLHTVLDAEPGFVFVGESSGAEENVWPVLNRSRPDLVLLDYHLPRGDGLQLCYRIKHDVLAPKVVIFTEYAIPALALPATLARADGLLHKGVGARELFEALRLDTEAIGCCRRSPARRSRRAPRCSTPMTRPSSRCCSTAPRRARSRRRCGRRPRTFATACSGSSASCVSKCPPPARPEPPAGAAWRRSRARSQSPGASAARPFGEPSRAGVRVCGHGRAEFWRGPRVA